jgi:hypothetical protein
MRQRRVVEQICLLMAAGKVEKGVGKGKDQGKIYPSKTYCQ